MKKNTLKKPSLDTLLCYPENLLSEDARLIKNYFIRLIRVMPNNIYWMDKNGIALGANDNVLNFVGLKRLEDFIGLSYEEIIKIAGWDENKGLSFKKDDQEVIATGKAKLNVVEPVFYDDKGNEVHYISSRIPLFDDEKNVVGVVGISVDIAYQKAT